MSLGELVEETSEIIDDLAPHQNGRLITDYFTAQAIDEGFQFCTACQSAPCSCPEIPEKEMDMKPAEDTPEAEAESASFASPREEQQSGAFGTNAATATATATGTAAATMSAGPAPAPAAPSMGGGSGGCAGGPS